MAINGPRWGWGPTCGRRRRDVAGKEASPSTRYPSTFLGILPGVDDYQRGREPRDLPALGMSP
jgi:hypothetical protein